MQCDTLTMRLAAEPDEPIDGDFDAHVRHCLHCQADRARYRRLRRLLRSLRDQQLTVSEGLLEEVLLALDEPPGHPSAPSRRRTACTIAAAAGAAGAAGALVLANRARSRRLVS